jgi:hypothetical protein
MQRTVFTAIVALVVSGVVNVAAQPQQTLRLGPGTRPGVFTTIQGSALNSTNGFLSDAQVRLRDARFGRIVDMTMTDKAGAFTFRGVDPGSYVVELVGKDQMTLAASQVLNVDAGAMVSAVVKLPFRIPPFGGLLGHSAASAVAVASAAAASGVLAREVTTCKSDPCGS